MSKNTKILLSLLTLCAVAIGVGWRSMNSPVTTANPNSGAPMLDKLEEKARKAKSNDAAAVHELADEVFANFDVEIPPELGDGMKERLVRAEMKYRKTGKGIRETHIVRTINELAEKFSAPDYAKTSPLQVRIMRVQMMREYPSFIAQETREKKRGLKKKVGDSINPEVSPLEGVFITSVLLWQKMLNDKWQQPADEWAATLHQKHFGELRRGNGDPKPKMVVNPLRNDKVQEMDDIVARGLAKLNIIDAKSLVDSTLDTLGIER